MCGSSPEITIGLITLSAPTCAVNLAVHEGEKGFLGRPCANAPYTFDAGGIQIVAHFPVDYEPPAVIFYGAMDENAVMSVCAGTTFIGSDGCTWASAQTITGPTPVACTEQVGPFTFSYAEQRVAGTNCHPACTATAPIFTQ